jgi:chromosome segregation ATPase
LTKFETKYSDALLVINEQNEQIQTLEAKLSETESKQESLKSELKANELEKNELAAKIVKLESELEVSLDEIKELKELREERRQENDSFENEINKLRDQISKLEQEKSKMEKLNLSLEQKIEALNKEKAFIVNQNEQQHKTVLSDYLSLQEKLTDLNYQINRLTSENSELKSFSKESKTMLENYENDFNELSSKFKQEVDEKNDALNKAKHFETMLEKVKYYHQNLKNYISFKYKKNLIKLFQRAMIN